MSATKWENEHWKKNGRKKSNQFERREFICINVDVFKLSYQTQGSQHFLLEIVNQNVVKPT